MSDDTESTAAITDMMTPELARHPHPGFRDLLAAATALKVDGVGVIACSRAAVDEVLRRPDVFSSSTDAIDLKARRPLIPLQIDPPAQRKFRKILDPLFSPQKMRRLEEPITALVNDLIDAFVDEDEIDFTRQFSIPFPSRVFLTLFGLPIEELPRFLAMKDGIIRPDHVVGHERGHPETDAHQQATADSIYGYFEGLLDERASVRRDDLLSEFLDAQI